ncbi:unnamed protein product [Protopolystoma xenopodis]|uniref:Uncharacterized protein n=1 Tax=Protopolystoma xenopodis TaxID=117903 RepID=A0A3S5AHY6_9PLAT|nr:unnamed protein product [Protopolystoma xenopodis]
MHLLRKRLEQTEREMTRLLAAMQSVEQHIQPDHLLPELNSQTSPPLTHSHYQHVQDMPDGGSEINKGDISQNCFSEGVPAKLISYSVSDKQNNSAEVEEETPLHILPSNEIDSDLACGSELGCVANLSCPLDENAEELKSGGFLNFVSDDTVNCHGNQIKVDPAEEDPSHCIYTSEEQKALAISSIQSPLQIKGLSQELTLRQKKVKNVRKDKRTRQKVHDHKDVAPKKTAAKPVSEFCKVINSPKESYLDSILPHSDGVQLGKLILSLN